MPRVLGQTLRQARASIVKHLCSIGRVSHAPSRQRLRGRVIIERPNSGLILRKGSPIKLTIGLGPRR